MKEKKARKLAPELLWNFAKRQNVHLINIGEMECLFTARWEGDRGEILRYDAGHNPTIPVGKARLVELDSTALHPGMPHPGQWAILIEMKDADSHLVVGKHRWFKLNEPAAAVVRVTRPLFSAAVFEQPPPLEYTEAVTVRPEGL